MDTQIHGLFEYALPKTSCIVVHERTLNDSKGLRMNLRKQFELKMTHTGPDGGEHYWLVANGSGVPVAYSKVYPDYFGRPVSLADIETREGFRNFGYASLILELIAEKFSAPQVHHDGAFTDDGYHYIAKLLNRSNAAPARVDCDDMSFVYDWDSFTPRYR